MTPALFELMVDDYWDKMYLNEFPLARISTQIRNAVVNWNLEEGHTPDVIQPDDIIVMKRRRHYGKEVYKTPEGTVTADDIRESEARAQQAAIKILKKREMR
jgi:hypothetical protein